MPHTTPRVTNSSLIAQRRLELGLTQEQLAERVGCKRREVSFWENGQRTPRLPTLIKIAAALSCQITDLIPTAKEE